MDDIGYTNDEEARFAINETSDIIVNGTVEDRLDRLARMEALYGSSTDDYKCELCFRTDMDMVKMTCDQCPLQLYCVACSESRRRIHNHHVCLTCSNPIVVTEMQGETVSDSVKRLWKDTEALRVGIGITLIALLILVLIAGVMAMIFFGLIFTSQWTWPPIVFYFEVSYSIDVLLDRQYFLELQNVTYVRDDGSMGSYMENTHSRQVEHLQRLVHLCFLSCVAIFYWSHFLYLVDPNTTGCFLPSPKQFLDRWTMFIPWYIYLPLYLTNSFVMYGFFYFVFEPYLYHAFIPKSWDWLSYEYLYTDVLDVYLFLHTIYLYSAELKVVLKGIGTMIMNNTIGVIHKKKETFILYNTRIS